MLRQPGRLRRWRREPDLHDDHCRHHREPSGSINHQWRVGAVRARGGNPGEGPPNDESKAGTGAPTDSRQPAQGKEA